MEKKRKEDKFKKFNKSTKSKRDKINLGEKYITKNIKTYKEENKDELIRLNKYIANSGLCPRREADKLIKDGLIWVNGKKITELGVKIKPGDFVKYNNKELITEKKVYILLNKPKDHITTVKDHHASKTVMDLIKNACKERVYPVGRLDRNTTGVLLFTNDGDLTKKLTHPGYNKKKVYHVFLDKNLKSEDFEKVINGLTLTDGFIKPDSMSYVDLKDKKQIGIEIHSGKNRIVKRIFEKLNYKIVKLDRVYFAGLTKKSLPRGKWRFLTTKEISLLKMDAYN